MNTNLELLKSVLSLKSSPGREDEVIDFIVDYCERRQYQYTKDSLGNILVTKGKPTEGEYYGLLCCHTDTVHNYQPGEKKNIIVEDDIMYSVNDYGVPNGIGADDLAGVVMCIMIMDRLDVIKVGFYVEEETGAHGVHHSCVVNKDWYSDIGWGMEFDSPAHQFTMISSGLRLFTEEFWNVIKGPINQNYGNNIKGMKHPYSNVYYLKKYFDFCLINWTVGYVDYHTNREKLIISEFIKSYRTALIMIEKLGNKKYYMEPQEPELAIDSWCDWEVELEEIYKN